MRNIDKNSIEEQLFKTCEFLDSSEIKREKKPKPTHKNILFKQNKMVRGSTRYDQQPNFSSISIIKQQKWLSFISSKYHSASIFLAIEQGWVSMGMLKRIYPICWSNYIKVLVNNGILVKFNPNKKCKEEISLINGIGNKVDSIKFYRLTDNAFSFFLQSQIFNCVKENIDSEIILSELNEFRERIVNSKKEADQKKMREQFQQIIKMKNLGIELNADQKKIYNSWRYKK